MTRVGLFMGVFLSGQLLLAERGLSQADPSIPVTHRVTISSHATVPLNPGGPRGADEILRKASELLQIKDGPLDIACNISLVRDGEITSFATNAPAVIENAADRDAIHAEKSFIKVVRQIKFCREGKPKLEGNENYGGCAWNPGRTPSIIISYPLEFDEVVWAHEFGHTTGLDHRPGPDNLMDPDYALARRQISRCECNSFHSGPKVLSATGPWQCTP
jgi:hypothetical protein